MPRSILHRSAASLGLSIPAADRLGDEMMALAPMDSGFPQRFNLPFTFMLQCLDQWCWAAIAFNVSRFYDPATTWTQCVLANNLLGLPGVDCCTFPCGELGTSSPCNRQGILIEALKRTGNATSVGEIPGPLAMDGIRSELASGGRPICAAISFPRGLVHFVIIHGFDGDFLFILDPILGSLIVPYDQFCTGYNTNGTWVAHYFTTSR